MQMAAIIKCNIQYVWNYWLKCIGVFAGILSIVFLFVSWDDIGITDLYYKVLLLAAACLVLLIWSLLWVCLLKKQKVIWQNASGRILVRYGDILREGFDKKNRTEKLYVIPVNSAFDTIVDDDVSRYNKPLVSSRSLHGRWIKKMEENGKDLAEIDHAIQANLEEQEKKACRIITLDEKGRGKRELYELGTIAAVKGPGRNTFLLLALTDFDDNNIAHVSINDFEHTIEALLRFYEQHGQGYDLVVPLMGTNLSKTGLNHEDSLRAITSKFRLYSDKIHGDVSIVIYNGDKGKVSIGI